MAELRDEALVHEEQLRLLYIERDQQAAKQRMHSELRRVYSTKLYVGSPIIEAAEEEVVVPVTLEAASVTVMEKCPSGSVGQEEEQTDVLEVVESILITDSNERPKDQAYQDSLRVASEGVTMSEMVHSESARLALLESLPGTIATMPKLLMWVASRIWDVWIPWLAFRTWDIYILQLAFRIWDVWIRSWPCTTAGVSQPSGLWRRGNYLSSRKRIKAGDSLSGSSSESEGDSTSSIFAFFVNCFFLREPSSWLVREPLFMARRELSLEGVWDVDCLESQCYNFKTEQQ